MKTRILAFAFRWLTPPAFDRWYIRRLRRKTAALRAEHDEIAALAASLKESQRQQADES